MLFNRYYNLYEEYSPKMVAEFKDYLKEIGDVLSKKVNISVKNSKFSEIKLSKPVVINSVNKEIKSTTNTYYNGGTVVGIFKHLTDGVSICTIDFYHDRFSAPVIIAQFGDTSGKVFKAFKAKVSDKAMDAIDDLHRDRKAAKRVVKDRHNIKAIIDKKMKYISNRNVNEILKSARAIGFDGKCYTIFDGEMYYLEIDLQWTTESTGITPSVSISLVQNKENMISDIEDELLDVKVIYNMSSAKLTLSNASKASDKVVTSELKKITDAYRNATKLAELINNYTFGDLVVEE